MKNNKIESIGNTASRKSRDRAINDGLSEIYQDDDGKMVDVKKLTIKRNRGWLFWSFNILMYLVLATGIYYGLKHFLQQGMTTDAIELKMSVEDSLNAGEEFLITVDYGNKNAINLVDFNIHLTYPENFIYLDSSPQADLNNNSWEIPSLPVGAEGQIKIKGKLISPVNQVGALVAEARYRPEGISAEFKKMANLDLVVSDLGLDFKVVHSNSILVGDRQKLVIKYRAREKYLDNFRLQINPANLSNVEFITDIQKTPGVTLIKPWVWQIDVLSDVEQELVVYYKVIEKLSDHQGFDLDFSYRLAVFGVDTTLSSASGSVPISSSSPVAVASSSIELSKPTETFYNIYHQNVEMELVKNNLNLLLVMNGSDAEQSVDFGQTLNYSLAFSNKGESNLENIVITAFVDGDLVDWTTFKDKYHGTIRNNTITWTRDNIPELGILTPGTSQAIDFSLQLKNANANAKSDQIRSYAQFQIQTGDDLESLIRNIRIQENIATRPVASSTDGLPAEQSALVSLVEHNKSNTIINKVNSDFRIDQQIKYFNDDNIPVGAGPLPLEVDKDTSLRVYWRLNNSFHDLNTIQMRVTLPEHVAWQEKSYLNSGSMYYDVATRQVVWEIQNMPKTTPELTAEFSVNVRPLTSQKNQIIVLLAPAEAEAIDAVTGVQVKRQAKVKTSKLEDDTIVRSVNLDAANGLIR